MNLEGEGKGKGKRRGRAEVEKAIVRLGARLG